MNLDRAPMSEGIQENYDVDRSVSPLDAMNRGDLAHYFSVGSSALTNIRHSLSVGNVNPPARILDFGCGAGRVTRWIVAAFPNAEIEGCDLRQADVDFVAKQFGIRTWVSGTNVASLTAPSTYDLIWVGSVFTHLPEEASIELFDKLLSWLNENSLLVLTSRGRLGAGRGNDYDKNYGIAAQWPGILQAFKASKFGYADYSGVNGYGTSLVPLSWWADLITSRPNTRLVTISEHAWDNHHDVLAIQKVCV